MNAGDLHHVIDGADDDDADNRRGTIVLVHGSWTDHATWQFVRPLLAEDHVVVAYDRGHSAAACPTRTQHRPMGPGGRSIMRHCWHDPTTARAAVSTIGIPAHAASRSSSTHRRPPRGSRRRTTDTNERRRQTATGIDVVLSGI